MLEIRENKRLTHEEVVGVWIRAADFEEFH